MPSPDEKPEKGDKSWGLPQTYTNPGSSQLSEQLIKQTMEALKEGRLQWPDAAEIQAQMRQYRAPLDRKLAKDAAEGRTSFISQQLQSQLQHWCLTDIRVDRFWHRLTDHVRRGLNDEIVSGVLRALGSLLAEYDQDMAMAKGTHIHNHAWLLDAADKVIEGYEDAVRRGDLLYMEHAVEELDAALDDLRDQDGSK